MVEADDRSLSCRRPSIGQLGRSVMQRAIGRNRLWIQPVDQSHLALTATTLPAWFLVRSQWPLGANHDPGLMGYRGRPYFFLKIRAAFTGKRRSKPDEGP